MRCNPIFTVFWQVRETAGHTRPNISMEEAHPPNGAASKNERQPTWQDAGTFADVRNRSHLRRAWLHHQALYLQPRFDVLATRRPELPQLPRQEAGPQQGLIL